MLFQWRCVLCDDMRNTPLAGWSQTFPHEYTENTWCGEIDQAI